VCHCFSKPLYIYLSILAWTLSTSVTVRQGQNCGPAMYCLGGGLSFSAIKATHLVHTKLENSDLTPTSRLDKDCGLFHLTIYSFLLSDCLLLDVAPSLSLALASTYLPMSPQHRLCSPSEND